MLDQFPRNLFRNDAAPLPMTRGRGVFARELVEAGVEDYALVERCFLYLPFEHSEELADQDLSVRFTRGCWRQRLRTRGKPMRLPRLRRQSTTT